MATEPISSGIFAGLVMKLGPLAAVGAVGGLIISLFDKAPTKRERAIQAGAAGVAAIVFGRAATSWLSAHISSIPKDDLLLPAGFLVGALSWGVFGALAQLRRTVADKAAQKAAEKLGL